jgi:hypothetical protein
MGKNQSASNLTNIIKQDANGNISFVSGSTTLMSVSSSGTIETTGNVAGTASYASNAELFDGLDSTVFATTGSNTFTSAQYISNTSTPTNFTDTASLYTDGGMQVKKDVYLSSSLFIKGDLTIFGTQSVNYITSSQLNIATNIVTVNTSTPAVRFGGLAVYDSGSLATGLTGSLLWDSQNNHWVYTNPSGSSYSGGMLISGPRASSLGEEQGTTNNALMKGQGGDHITSSGIFESGSNVGIGTASPAYKLDVQGTGRFTDALIVNKVAINSGNLTLSNFPSLDLIVSGGIGFSSGGSGAAALVNRDGSGNITFYGSSGDIKFTDITLTSNYLTIKNAGNVGIGTASPNEKLHVYGNADSSKSRFELYGTGGINEVIQLVNTANYNPDRGVKMGFYVNEGTNNNQLGAEIGSAVSAATSAYLFFSTNNSGTIAERMRITSAGNLGINTSTAGATLPSGPGWTTQPTRVRVLQINSTDGYANAGLFLRQTDESTGLDLWSDNYYGDVYIDSRWNNVAGNMYFRLKTSSTAIIPLTITARGQFIASYGQTGGYNRTDSGYVNETINITANCTAYFLYKYSGAGNGSSSTNFNITGVSTTNGTWLDVCIRARKDATGNAINTTAVFQINGSTIDSIAASGTGAQQRDKTLRVVRMSDEWIVVGTPYTV